MLSLYFNLNTKHALKHPRRQFQRNSPLFPMTKKMKLPSIFKTKADQMNAWQWPSCAHAKTLSFRADAGAGAGIFKTVNSVYLDPAAVDDGVDTPESCFTNTSESASFSTGESDDERIIVTGVRSDRLFFDRADTSSSLAAAAAAAAAATPPENQENHEEEEEAPFAASVVMAMDSDDPYADFKKSMEEMVESQGMRDWESLQELLGWYLKMNGKANHGFIVGAFVDLLIQLTSSSSSSSSSSPKTFHDFPSNVVSTSYSSALSTLSSPPTSPLSSLDLKEIHEQG